MQKHRHFYIFKWKAYIIIAVIAIIAGLVGGFGASKIFFKEGGTKQTEVSSDSHTAESEETEMAKTTDRISIDGEDYMIQDTETKSSVDLLQLNTLTDYDEFLTSFSHELYGGGNNGATNNP